MALINFHFHSEVLELNTTLLVILPTPKYGRDQSPLAQEHQKKYPVLYLLHGLSGDCTDWLRQTAIERYVKDRNIAVVMPMVDRSYYTDMASGPNYWTFISEEVPFLLGNLFPLSQRRESTFAAGLSMGGYGAVKLALSHPDRFSAAASLSGVLDIVSAVTRGDAIDNDSKNIESTRIFGSLNQLVDSQNDLFYLARLLSNSDTLKPKLFICCGTEDDHELYFDNIRFKELALNSGLDITYEEGPGGHDWSYWDRQIQQVLKWLPIPTIEDH
jgi:putative tributyrin esterase